MKSGIALSIALLWLAAAPYGSAQVNQRLKGKKTVIRTAVVIPAVLSSSLSEFSPATPEDSDAVRLKFSELVSKHLGFRGVEIVSSPLSGERSEEATMRFQRLGFRYDSVMEQVRKSPGGISKGRYSLGDAVAGLGNRADVLVVATGSGAMSHRKGSSKLYFSGELAFVDPRSGELLAATGFTSENLAEALADMPFPNSADMGRALALDDESNERRAKRK